MSDETRPPFRWRQTWPDGRNPTHFGSCIRNRDGAKVGAVVRHFDGRWQWSAYNGADNPRGLEAKREKAMQLVEQHAAQMTREPAPWNRADYKVREPRAREIDYDSVEDIEF